MSKRHPPVNENGTGADPDTHIGGAHKRRKGEEYEVFY